MTSGTQHDVDEETRRDGPGSGSPAPAPAGPPFRIGPYAVLSRVGEGAMGVVYVAFDERLDRKVALKLLHALQRQGSSGKARLMREAQALARVSHPNVVPVHEVGEHDGEVYVVMEFVRGQTLRQWRHARPRGWREVLGLYVQAGRGLAAAHAAGVVHRDFKPDNAMIGDDGRVRVMDFGLARAVDRTDAPALTGEPRPAEDGAAAELRTVAGTILGTPAYMAPEQHLATDVGALADQFAFCVALFEGLYGERPFAGADMRTLLKNITLGKPREPAGRDVPGWLRQIVLRGLSPDPEQRWPTMAALLARVERGQALARLSVAGVVVLAVGALIAGAWSWTRAEAARREATCEAAGAEIAAVWNDEVRAGVRAAIVRTGVEDAAQAAGRVMPLLDRQAAAWTRARADACRDADTAGAWSADALDRSLWCLDERRVELAALIDELAHADAAVVHKAVPAALGLGPLATCRDAAALARLPAPPVEGRDEARAIRSELAHSANLGTAGKYEASLAVAVTAQTRAEAFAWPPLVAAARLRVARSLERGGQYKEAEAALEEAVFAAMEAGAPGVAVEAATGLIDIVGWRLARFDEGLRWARLARLWLREVEPRAGLRTADTLINTASVHVRQGAVAEARTLQEQALAIQTEILGEEHLLVARTLQELAYTNMMLGDLPGALVLNARTLTICEALLGPHHVDVARVLSYRTMVLRDMGRHAEALALVERVLATFERQLGPDHPDVGTMLAMLAELRLRTGADDGVRALLERSLAIYERLGAETLDVAAALDQLGNFDMTHGELARARELYARSLAIHERHLGPAHREVALALVRLAAAERALGAPDTARTLLERALGITETLSGRDHVDTLAQRIPLAELELAAGRTTGARAHLERAQAIRERAGPPDDGSVWIGLAQVALSERRPGDAVRLAGRAALLLEQQGGTSTRLPDARFALARALWDAPDAAGRDRRRARELAHTARDGLRAAKGREPQLAEVEQWLADHRD